MESNSKSFDWALYCSMVSSILLAVLCSLILAGLVYRQSKAFSCLKHWVLIPSLAILVCFAFGFSVIFVLGSMAAADMCVDSPDNRILVILNRFKEQLTPLAVDFASFYINECPEDGIPEEFSTQINAVLDTLPTLGTFSSLVTESSASIQVVCGLNDPSQLAIIADTANAQLCDVAAILEDIRLFFQCENWFPLYEATVYDTICYDGTDGFAWIAITQFMIVFFSFVLLTCRAAFQDIEVEEHNDKGDSTDDESYTPRHSQQRFAPRITPSDRGDEFELSYVPK